MWLVRHGRAFGIGGEAGVHVVNLASEKVVLFPEAATRVRDYIKIWERKLKSRAPNEFFSFGSFEIRVKMALPPPKIGRPSLPAPRGGTRIYRKK